MGRSTPAKGSNPSHSIGSQNENIAVINHSDWSWFGDASISLLCRYSGKDGKIKVFVDPDKSFES